MSEREEGYRAEQEARAGYARRAAGSSHTGVDAVTRLVNAAVYRDEHQEDARRHDGDGEEEPPGPRPGPAGD